AAFPVAGPIDVIIPGKSGVLKNDLKAAALAALNLDREVVRAHAAEYSWERATAQFLRHLQRNGARACHARKSAQRTARPASSGKRVLLFAFGIVARVSTRERVSTGSRAGDCAGADRIAAAGAGDRTRAADRIGAPRHDR